MIKSSINPSTKYISRDNCREKAKPFVQPKLSINMPGDVYEQEADTMADKIVNTENIDKVSSAMPPITVQRKCADCEDEEKQNVQRKESGEGQNEEDHSLESYVGNLSGSGQSLPNDVRNFYEPRFGHDFSNVKIHTDNIATKSAQSINAQAYTTGNNIVFNDGQYSPGNENGKRLLAHELTHVIQQSSSIQRKCGSPNTKLDKTDINAVLAEILPPLKGLLAEINRTVQLEEIFGVDLSDLAKRIVEDPVLTAFTCANGVGGMAALYDTRFQWGKLNINCARSVLSLHPEHYNTNALDKGKRHLVLPNIFSSFSSSVNLFEKDAGKSVKMVLDKARRLQVLDTTPKNGRLHVRVMSTRDHFCVEGFIDTKSTVEATNRSLKAPAKVALVFVQNTERIGNDLMSTRAGKTKSKTTVRLSDGKKVNLDAGDHINLREPEDHTATEFSARAFIGGKYENIFIAKSAVEDDIKERTNQRMYMINVASKISAERKTMFVDINSGLCSDSKLPIEYFTGADIVRGILAAGNCVNAKVEEIHIVSHGGSHGISGTGDVQDNFGIYLQDKLITAGAGGMKTDEFVNSTASHLADSVRIWIHGCLTATDRGGKPGFAEELGSVVRSKLGGTSSVAGLADRGRVDRGFVRRSSFVIFPGRKKETFPAP